MSLFPISFGKVRRYPDFFSSFDHLLDDAIYKPTYQSDNSSNTTPLANVVKSDKGFTIEMAAPGLSRDEFQIDIENNTLSISVSTEDSQSYKDSVTMREYSFASFCRSWSLPENTNPQGISARYDAGILYVSIPVEGTKNSKRSISVE